MRMEYLRCLNCGAFVKPDNESNADYWHYHCINCQTTGYIKNKYAGKNYKDLIHKRNIRSKK